MSTMMEVKTRIKGLSPIGFSKAVSSEKETGESDAAFEERTWKEKAHYDSSGTVVIPSMAIKKMLVDCAMYLQESVKGKGKATYTKYFTSGILVTESPSLGIKEDKLEKQRVFVPSDGKPGGGKRVWKSFPIIRNWETDISLWVVEPILQTNPEKIREYLEHSGKFIGLGWFRIRRGGYYGRFDVVKFAFK